MLDVNTEDKNTSLYNENLGGKAYNVVKSNFFSTINICVEDINLACNFMFGFCLKSYKFDNYKSSKKNRFEIKYKFSIKQF